MSKHTPPVHNRAHMKHNAYTHFLNTCQVETARVGIEDSAKAKHSLWWHLAQVRVCWRGERGR